MDGISSSLGARQSARTRATMPDGYRIRLPLGQFDAGEMCPMLAAITTDHGFSSVDQAALEAGLRDICGIQDRGGRPRRRRHTLGHHGSREKVRTGQLEKKKKRDSTYLTRTYWDNVPPARPGMLCVPVGNRIWALHS